jgi:hypothetical protein
VEWSLDGPLPTLCPVIPTSNQDGHQAKNRKRGDEILIVHCCYGFKGEDLNVIFYQNMPNLHNRYISAERKISQKKLEYKVKMRSNFNCSYMARSSLAYVWGFCLKFFFQPIYTDYAN